MRDFRDAKAMAQALREALAIKSVSITHSECLELVAKQFGLADWNTLSAKIEADPVSTSARTPQRRALAFSAKAPNQGMKLPLVPLRDIVFFPGMTAPLVMGRAKSIRAVEYAAAHGGSLLLVAQRNPIDDDPDLTALYSMGVIAIMLQFMSTANGEMLAWVQAEDRAVIRRATTNSDEFTEVEIAPAEKHQLDGESHALARAVHEEFLAYATTSFPARTKTLRPLPDRSDPARLADAMVPALPIDIHEKQDLLETIDVAKRIEKIRAILLRVRAPA